MSSSLGKFLVGALVGGAVGAAIGMLLAPRSGLETRAIIREEFENRYQQGANAVRDQADKLKEKAESFKDKAREIADELEETGRRTISKFTQDKTSDVPS